MLQIALFFVFYQSFQPSFCRFGIISRKENRLLRKVFNQSYCFTAGRFKLLIIKNILPEIIKNKLIKPVGTVEKNYQKVFDCIIGKAQNCVARSA